MSQAQSEWVALSESCSWQGTHKMLLNNILLLGTELILIALMATGIYNRNPGPRALKIMYREVRNSFSCGCLGMELICSYMFILGSRLAPCGGGGSDCASGKNAQFVYY